jgi:hypothetical protein
MKNFLIILLVASATIFAQTNYSISTPAEKLIKNAIESRNIYFSNLNGKKSISDMRSTISNWLPELKKERNRSTIWYNYLTGLSWHYKHQSPKKAFSNALNLAKTDQGNLWVLYLEFQKIKNDEWSKKTLFELKKLYLTNGITDVPAIRTQFQLLARDAFTSGNRELSDTYLENANQFSSINTPQISTRLFVGGANVSLFSSLKEYVTELKNSWIVQVILLKKIYSLFKIVATVFIIIILSLMSAKYYSKTVHHISCLYPKSSPYKIRILYSSLILAALLTISFYPLIILLALLLLRTADKGLHKNLIRVAATLLLLFPLDSYISLFFNQTISSNYIAQTYLEARDGAPTIKLKQKISNYLSNKDINDDAKSLLHTSLALYEYKKNRINAAMYSINNALKISETNEATLTAAGVIYYANGKKEDGRNFLQKAVELYPTSPEANYNYGQINLEEVSTIDGSNYISTASKINPLKVNRFISDNSTYFNDGDWPKLRHFFISSLSPKQFWASSTSYILDTPNGSKAIWGSKLFGIPPLITIILLFIVFQARNMVGTNRKKKKRVVGSCTLCGKPTCRKCDSDDLCNECHTSLTSITNSSLVDSMKNKLSTGKRVRIRIRGLVMEMLFPGSRGLYLKSKKSFKNIFLLPITLVLYSLYLVIAFEPITLFPEPVYILKIVLVSLIFIFNFVFIVKFIKALKSESSSNRMM